MINATDIDERRGCTSASNALADSLCPARHLMQRGKARIESEYSSTGDRVHKALASGKREGLSFEENETVDACLEIERKKVTEFFGEEAAKATCYREDPEHPQGSRLWVRVRTSTDQFYEHSCRPDTFYRLRDRALIIEYKTLFGDVPESPRNLQLRDQQVIVRGNLLVTGDIGVVVIQPHVERDPQICIYTPDDSKRAEKEMFDRVIASNQPGQTPIAGETQCKFCLARSSCLQHIQWAGAMVPAMLNLMEVPMELWEPTHRARAAAAIGPARKLIDDIEAHIMAGLEKDPTFCPGWWLKPGNVVEKIVNPQECFQRALELGVDQSAFMKTVSIGKTKLKQVVADATNTKGKKLETVMAQLCEGLTESKRNSPSLKPADEK